MKFLGIRLHYWILIAMGVGLVAGLLLHQVPADRLEPVAWWLDLFGKTLFIGALKMIIAPLILASIIAGITSLPSARELGNIGWKTLAYYMLTTTLAVAIGLVAVLVIRPGHKEASQSLRQAQEVKLAGYRAAYAEQVNGDPLSEAHRPGYMEYIATQEGQSVEQSGRWAKIQGTRGLTPGEMFKRDILGPILTNPFHALANMNSLGIIVFAVLVGLACLAIGEAAKPVASFFQGFNAVMMTITHWVMWMAPIGIGCIIARLVATQGLTALKALAWYSVTVVAGIGVHILVLLLIVRFLGSMSPGRFLNGMRNAWVIAFTTTSSAATLPVTMECVTEELEVSPKVANFGLPLGATVNMDGTALYEGVAIIFLIQLYGGLDDVPILLTAATTLIIFITAVLASVGAAAVPSAGLITMAIVANAVGLPLHYIVVIFAVDHLLDMFRTSTNVLGDAAGAVVVSHLERDRL